MGESTKVAHTQKETDNAQDAKPDAAPSKETSKETPAVKTAEQDRKSVDGVPNKDAPKISKNELKQFDTNVLSKDATRSSERRKSVDGKETPVAKSVKHYKLDKDAKKLNLKHFIKKHLQAGASKMNYELSDLHQLLDLAKVSMQKMPTLVEVTAPVNICDYVDRGKHSLEVIVLLLACKVKFPNNVFLLRGNHELQHINRVYGFRAELQMRYKNLDDSKLLYDHFNEVFAEMPLAALVSGKILCMHGGLSPLLNSLDDIRNIKRPIVVVRGLEQDLLWADPEPGVKGFQPNTIRGVSHIFGEDAVEQKIKQLGIDMVIRAHQVIEYGYSFFASRKLITIFSAERYHEDLCNYAAVVQVDSKLEVSFMQLKPSEFEATKKERVERTADEPEDESTK